MATIDVKKLRLNVYGAAGHEHRLAPIAYQAGQILAARLADRWPAARSVQREFERLQASPLELNLAYESDAQAAERIAGAWFEEVMARIGE